MRAEASIVVPVDIGAVWTYVSNYNNFTDFIGHVERIQMLGDTTAEWKLGGSLAHPLIFKTVTTEISPARHMSWKSVEGLDSQGSVHLEPDGDGTRVTLCLQYSEPDGDLGKTFAILFQDSQGMIEEDLRRLAALLEQGPPAKAAKKEPEKLQESPASSSSTANPLESEIVKK